MMIWSNTRFACICIASMLIVPLISSDRSKKDGMVEQLKFAQSAVELNAEKCSCISVGFKDVCISVAVYPQNPLRESNIARIIYKHPKFFISYVGRRADCLAARRFSINKESTQTGTTGVDLDAPTLALILADDAQERSRTPGRPLAYNALIMGAYPTPNGISTGIFKVDVGGNAFKCQAACIGTLASRVELWMRQRGAYIAWEMNNEDSLHQEMPNHPSSNLNSEDNPTEYKNPISSAESTIDSSRTTSLEQCFNLIWKCLNETVGTKRLLNCSIEIAVASKLDSYGPYMLPDDWLEEAADTVSKASKVNATVVVSDISTRSLTEMNIKAQGHPDEHEIVRPRESMDENRDQKSCSRDDAKEFFKWRSQHDSPLWRWWQKSQFIRKAGSYQPIL